MGRFLKNILYQARFQTLSVILAFGVLALTMPAWAFFHQKAAALLEIRSSGPTLLSEEVVKEIRGIKNVVKLEGYLLIKTQPYDVIGLETGAPLRIITRDDKLIQGKLEAGNGFSDRSEGSTVAIVGKNVDSVEYRIRETGEGQRGGGQRTESMRTMRHPLEIGQTFKLTDRESRIRVIGEYSSNPDTEADKVFLPLSTAQKLFGLKGKISHLFVTVDSPGNLQRVTKEMDAILKGDIKVIGR